MSTIIPHTISIILSDVHLASFSYYDGLSFVKQKSLKQTTFISDLTDYKHFMVCCGNIMFRVSSEDFPEIERV